MSCIHCDNKNKGITTTAFPCLCDEFVFPDPPDIGAGLTTLPRQIASFPEFRRAMLHQLKTEAVNIIDKNNQKVTVLPFAGWRARDKNDLGIMLLEMWAYVCDSISFYDEVIADESYVERPVSRELVLHTNLELVHQTILLFSINGE